MEKHTLSTFGSSLPNHKYLSLYLFKPQSILSPIFKIPPSLSSSLMLLSTLQASTLHAVDLRTTSSFLFDLFEEDEDGKWFNADTKAIIAQALQTGGGPNVSEAYTINGLPGPLYNCSKKGTKCR